MVGGTNYYIESLLWKVLISGAGPLTAPAGASSAKRGNSPAKTVGGSESKKAKVDSSNEMESLEPVVSAASGVSEVGLLPADDDDVDEQSSKLENVNMRDLSMKDLEKMPSAKLHECLKKFDPVTAERLHPNNRRKILR